MTSMPELATDDALAAAATLPDDAALVGLRDLALAHVNRLREIERAEAALTELKAKARDEAERILPERLAALGVTAVPLSNGATLELKPFAAAGIAPEKKEAAMAWFTEQGLADLIKNEVVVSFGRGEDELAVHLYDQVVATGQPVERKRYVHSQTLNAFVRSRIAAGEPLPTDLIDVYAGQHVKLKLPRQVTLAEILGG